jgi:F-type H+-transporting ATPase subunit a
MAMGFKRFKSLLVAVLTIHIFLFSNVSIAQHEETHGEAQKPATEAVEGHEKKEGFNANEVIFDHILDAHEFHFFNYTGKDGKEHHVSIPLPVILYSPEKGLSVFMSSAFHHGEHEVDGYKLVGNKIMPVDPAQKVYNFSLTRNVVQMMLGLIILMWILISMANKYKRNGSGKAPSGLQNAIEPVITFIRDEVAIPNLGPKYKKYLPYLLTVFFFILINNIFGLIPGSANVTGNIAFTLVLAVISFIVILISTNKHFWGHIFNPPVPGFVKGILVPVEILGVFTKPFALMIRLFANMMAGHIIIICLISLIFIFGGLSKGIGWGFSPISIAFAVFIYLIEILVAFIQAFIFTNLTAVFIGQAFEGEHHEEAHH